MTVFQNWGDYWWPGQYEQCLRNILHESVTDGREIHDPDELARIERQLTTIRAAQLIATPGLVEHTFTTEHYHALHRALFSDVYEWAGVPRVVTTMKGDSRFADPEDIDRLLALVLDNLGDPVLLRTAPRHELLDTLTQTLTGALMIHPHLEGNGRTSRLFLQHVAAAAGHSIDWTAVPAAHLVDATIAAFRLEPQPLRRILEDITHPLHATERADQLRQRIDTIPQPGTRNMQPGRTQRAAPADPSRNAPPRRPHPPGPDRDPGPAL